MNTSKIIISGKNYNRAFYNVIAWEIIKDAKLLYIHTKDNIIHYISTKGRDIIIE